MTFTRLPRPQHRVPLTGRRQHISTRRSTKFTLLFLRNLFNFFRLHRRRPHIVPRRTPNLHQHSNTNITMRRLLTRNLFRRLSLPQSQKKHRTFTTNSFKRATIIRRNSGRPGYLRSRFIRPIRKESYYTDYTGILSKYSRLSREVTDQWYTPLYESTRLLL